MPAEHTEAIRRQTLTLAEEFQSAFAEQVQILRDLDATDPAALLTLTARLRAARDALAGKAAERMLP